jgi:hydrophobic/amphiphilic exporter-1 (mainly G- bacteria), HAE1 family
VAATDLRDAVSRVQNALPEATDAPRVVKSDADSEAILRIAVTSSRRTADELTTLIRDLAESRLLAAPGVADLQIFGDRELAFRVDVDLIQLAARGLTLADLRTVLANAAFDSPAGSLSSDRQSLQVRTTAAIRTAEQIEALTIAGDVRLGDVATHCLSRRPCARWWPTCSLFCRTMCRCSSPRTAPTSSRARSMRSRLRWACRS